MLHLQLIIFSVRDDVPIDSDVLLMTDFVNLNIKLAQSFICVYRGSMCVFIEMSVDTCMSIRVCVVFLKK
jgi:hypothetical protein